MSKEGEYGIVIGTYEEGLAWVGAVGEPRLADVPVNLSAGRKFAAAVRDGSPLWWDDQVAEEIAGGPVVPPATLVSWGVAYEWRPGATKKETGTFLTSVPLPGDSMINVRSEIEFFDHVRVGDVYTITEEVESISPEKQTGAGPGHFLSVVAWYRRQNGEAVALQRNVILRVSTGGAR